MSEPTLDLLDVELKLAALQLMLNEAIPEGVPFAIPGDDQGVTSPHVMTLALAEARLYALGLRRFRCEWDAVTQRVKVLGDGERNR